MQSGDYCVRCPTRNGLNIICLHFIFNPYQGWGNGIHLSRIASGAIQIGRFQRLLTKNRMTNTESPEAPIFVVPATALDKFSAWFQIAFGLGVIIYFLPQISRHNWGMPLLLLGLFLVMVIQGMRSPKTYLLYKDKLVVRQPLYFSPKTDTIFILSDIREVGFNNRTGRFGGPHLYIRSKRLVESYRIDFPEETVDRFVQELVALGVKAVKKEQV